MRNLFTQITRYSESLGANHGENLLTEITAATLERVPELSFEFARFVLEKNCPSWIREGSCDSVDISTQRPAHGALRNGFVDLVLEFSRDTDESPERFTIYVEIKKWSPLSGDQLDVYAEDLDRLGIQDSSHLVMLTPESFSEAPGTRAGAIVPVVHWESLGRQLNEFRRAHMDIENLWVLTDYLNYLKLEGLMSAKPVDIESLMYMALYPDANKTILELHRIAIDRIAEWGDTGGGGYVKNSFGPGTFHHFSPGGTEQLDWHPDCWFESSFRINTALHPDREKLVFYAGVTFGRRSAVPPELWFADMAAHGFKRFEDDGYLRCMRILDPAELLGQDSVQSQGLSVADWTLESFQILKTNPPQAAAAAIGDGS